MTLRMVNLIQNSLVNQLMLCEQLWFLRIFKNTHLDHQILDPVGSLNFIEVELSFKGVVNLIVTCKQVINYLNDWIIESESLWVRITTKLVGNVDLLTLFEFKNEHSFLQFNLFDNGLQVEIISETSNTNHELDLSELCTPNHSFEFHLKLHAA